jgi:transglutaminase-like putative cysteine protease
VLFRSYTAGTYKVTYTATDSSDNRVTLSCRFTFVEETVTDEELNAAADAVLAEITTPDMSIGYKAYAIYHYVFDHIKYNGISNKTDWKYEAYRGITTGRGDCFTFYATAKCLLERIGAQTMCVERHGGNRTTHHYWLLVDLGTGWYHLDAINVGPRNYECFMRTDAELRARGANFWSFDHSLYPPTPTESYQLK